MGSRSWPEIMMKAAFGASLEAFLMNSTPSIWGIE